jgi:outer membrane protein
MNKQAIFASHPRHALKTFTAAALALTACVAVAQPSAEDAAERQAQQVLPTPQNFIGLGVGVLPKVPGSSGVRFLALPVIQYQYKDVAYISGLKAGAWGFVSADESLRIGVYAEPRFGYTASDSIKTAGMADRDFAADAGPTLRWQTGAGVLNIEYGFDVTGRSKGQTAQVQFIRPLVTDMAFRLNGIVGATWQDAKMNDYYFGVRSSEAASGRAAYTPGSGTAFSVGLSGLLAFNRSGAMFFGASINRLSSAQASSPIVEQNYTPVAYVGYGWRM